VAPFSIFFLRGGGGGKVEDEGKGKKRKKKKNLYWGEEGKPRFLFRKP